jgi:hypothetical protein
MKKIFKRVLHLLKEIFPAFVFFLAMFQMLLVTKAIALKQYGITFDISTASVIGALIVAKTVLIADRIPFLNIYPRRPLIWNVVLKTIVFGLIASAFLIIESLIRESRQLGDFSAAWRQFISETSWLSFWAKEAWINILILFYCTAIEFGRVIGSDRAREIFFGRPRFR